ncbi:MAG TPA: LPS assembly lipoprotein LptE [Phycisphaerae bacterium]|nr:LPS assembly lipoprotein LptE [Phycisphaerae bacterium]
MSRNPTMCTTIWQRPTRIVRPMTGRWVPALLLLAATGCGYSSDGLYRKNIRTVYVEMFQSKEFRRGIEFQLTEALRKQIDRSTPYRNASKEKADTILSGEILEWREATLGRDMVSALPRETAATLAIRYRWQDMRTGKLLVDKERMITTIEYVRPVGETVYDARDDAVNRLARKVVASMETPW